MKIQMYYKNPYQLYNFQKRIMQRRHRDLSFSKLIPDNNRPQGSNESQMIFLGGGVEGELSKVYRKGYLKSLYER
jgi:hypothetical protein